MCYSLSQGADSPITGTKEVLLGYLRWRSSFISRASDDDLCSSLLNTVHDIPGGSLRPSMLDRDDIALTFDKSYTRTHPGPTLESSDPTFICLFSKFSTVVLPPDMSPPSSWAMAAPYPDVLIPAYCHPQRNSYIHQLSHLKSF